MAKGLVATSAEKATQLLLTKIAFRREAHAGLSALSTWQAGRCNLQARAALEPIKTLQVDSDGCPLVKNRRNVAKAELLAVSCFRVLLALRGICSAVSWQADTNVSRQTADLNPSVSIPVRAIRFESRSLGCGVRRSGGRTLLCCRHKYIEHIFVEQIDQLPGLVQANPAQQIESHDSLVQSGNGVMQ